MNASTAAPLAAVVSGAAAHAAPRYRRILLKLSGEALMGDDAYGINREVIDRIVGVSDTNATAMTARLAREEGLMVGVSSGANVWAALHVAAKLGPGKTVVTFVCDTGERYISTRLFTE